MLQEYRAHGGMTGLPGGARKKKRCSAPIYRGGTSTATRIGRRGKIPHSSKSRRAGGRALRYSFPSLSP